MARLENSGRQRGNCRRKRTVASTYNSAEALPDGLGRAVSILADLHQMTRREVIDNLMCEALFPCQEPTAWSVAALEFRAALLRMFDRTAPPSPTRKQRLHLARVPARREF